MARNLNSFNPNPLCFGFSDDAMDHILVSLNSNLGENHVIESNLINSQLPDSNSQICVYQNKPIPHRGHEIVSHGQLGLSRRVTEVRRTHVTPHRIQVHSFIDYFPGQQNQSIFPQNEVTFTEVVKTTKFLTSTPTFFTPNDIFHLHDQNNFQKHTLPTSNLLNHSPTNYESSYNLYPSLESNKNQVINEYECDMGGDLVQSNTLLPHEPADHMQQFSHMHKSPPIMNPCQIKIERDIDGDLVPRHQLMGVKSIIQQFPHVDTITSTPIEIENDNDGIEGKLTHLGTSTQECTNHYKKLKPPFQEGDGRTRSLPHDKYGPYTCPKCRNVFSISQTFAAHMLTHYKNESGDERKKRLAAKYKRKNLRLVHRHSGMTMLPMSSKSREKDKQQQEIFLLIR